MDAQGDGGRIERDTSLAEQPFNGESNDAIACLSRSCVVINGERLGDK